MIKFAGIKLEEINTLELPVLLRIRDIFHAEINTVLSKTEQQELEIHTLESVVQNLKSYCLLKAKHHKLQTAKLESNLSTLIDFAVNNCPQNWHLQSYIRSEQKLIHNYMQQLKQQAVDLEDDMFFEYRYENQLEENINPDQEILALEEKLRLAYKKVMQKSLDLAQLSLTDLENSSVIFCSEKQLPYFIALRICKYINMLEFLLPNVAIFPELSEPCLIVIQLLDTAVQQLSKLPDNLSNAETSEPRHGGYLSFSKPVANNSSQTKLKPKLVPWS